MDNLAEAVLSYWHFLLFSFEEDLDPDLAAKKEEDLIHQVLTSFTIEEKKALQQAAQKCLELEIDPEDESKSREQRFYAFLAAGRFDDVDLL